MPEIKSFQARSVSAASNSAFRQHSMQLTRTSSGLPKASFFCVIRWRSLSHKKPSLLATADVGVSFLSVFEICE